MSITVCLDPLYASLQTFLHQFSKRTSHVLRIKTIVRKDYGEKLPLRTRKKSYIERL